MKKEMLDAIKEIVVPFLRAKGFKGSFPYFRRESEDKLKYDFLVFQFNKWGGSFTIEVTSFPINGIITASGDYVPPEKMTHVYLPTGTRLRLGAKGNGEDFWFNYEKINSREGFEKISKEVIQLIENDAEEWWRTLKF